MVCVCVCVCVCVRARVCAGNSANKLLARERGLIASLTTLINSSLDPESNSVLDDKEQVRICRVLHVVTTLHITLCAYVAQGWTIRSR